MTDGRPAVFLDRDGCVNVEDDHIRDISQLRLYPDSLESVRRLNEAGFVIVIVTNQSGVARGYMTEDLVRETNALLVRWLEEGGARVDAVEYCPHHPEGAVDEYTMSCDCRKPETGMLERAAGKLSIDFSKSYIVGDKISDVIMGPATGARAVLVRTGFGERELMKIEGGECAPPDYVAAGIGEAVDWILRDSGLPARRG